MSKENQILFETTDVFAANREYMEMYKILVNQGGTYSTKTYSILQLLALVAFQSLRYVHKIITVVGQDIPNLKVGAMRDFGKIVDSSPILKAAIKHTNGSWMNKTDRIVQFHNGFIIEFKSYDDWQDAKSGKRDFLFVNEANGIPLKVWEMLVMRTEFNAFIDYNPDAAFWCHEKVIGKENVRLIVSDHRHNTFLSREQHDSIENIDDKELWKVYARGLTGRIEGVIFKYDVVPDLPMDEKGQVIAKKITPGLDFGFTNDPTAVIDVYLHGGDLYLDQVMYERGLTNVPVQGAESQKPNISDRLTELGVSKAETIIADSAEEKSCVELEQAGWSIERAKKGPDSVKNGIDIMKRYKIKITERSTHLRKEFNTYKWKQDKDGNPTNEPVDFNNHGIDAVRYVCLNRLNNQGEEDYSNYFN